MRIVMIFVDGLGLPGDESRDGYLAYPTLARLMRDHCTPLDATLGIAGLPQSATGQATLLTGVNAPAKLGRHWPGFPNAALRELVERENIFSKFGRAGHAATFANAYVRMPGNELPTRFRSVTTVATLAAFGKTRTREDLLAGKAVYHDIVRDTLPGQGIPDIPLISESTAANHLMDMLETVDFCLFEYFLTDRAGHAGELKRIREVLWRLDAFLAALLQRLDPARHLLVLASDHGNIESPGSHHTANPVPLIAFGKDAKRVLDSALDLTDVTPAMLDYFR